MNESERATLAALASPVEWVLADSETYFRCWTAIGPCGTRRIEEAERFPSESAAMQSPAFTFPLTFYRPLPLTPAAAPSGSEAAPDSSVSSTAPEDA